MEPELGFRDGGKDFERPCLETANGRKEDVVFSMMRINIFYDLCDTLDHVLNLFTSY